MKQTWLILAAVVLLPLSASAHPGALDRNGCHFCRVDCQLYGLEKGDYVCHLGDDRTLNLTYKEVGTLRRHLGRLTKPALRQVARVLRARDAMRNKINARDPECRYGIDEEGNYKAPLLSRYRRLGNFGELLTAFACKNDLDTVPMLDAQGNIVGGLTLILRRQSTPIIINRLRRAGFTCYHPVSESACTTWTTPEAASPAASMKGLLSIASSISIVADNALLVPMTAEDFMIFREATRAMASADLSSSNWTEFCSESRGFCVPVHKSWVLVREPDEPEAFQRTYDFSVRLDTNTITPIRLQMSPQSLPVEPVKIEDGSTSFRQGLYSGYRQLREDAFLHIMAPAALRSAVDYMNKRVRAIDVVQPETSEEPAADEQQPALVETQESSDVSFILSASYVCFDGETRNDNEEPQCQSQDFWRQRAEEYCLTRCAEESGQCGVELFEQGETCELEEEGTAE